jgi:hypothetical protein
MEPAEVLVTLVIGVILGVVGQGIRFALGSLPRSPTFQPKPAVIGLAISAFVGATAGVVGAVSFLGKTLTADDVIRLIVLGYLGTDVIEQFVKAKFPGARAT